MRDANSDLKDALHEARQDYLLTREDRDRARHQLQTFAKERSNLEGVIQSRVARALETNGIELKRKIDEQAV